MPATASFARRSWLFGLVIGLSLTVLVVWLLRPVPPSALAPSATDGWFSDITSASGIDFIHDPGPFDRRYFMPQIVGSGAAMFDADGDGRLDIYLLNNGGPNGRANVIYLQQADGTFRDASAGSGLDVAGYGMGVAIGDVNNDGQSDVIVTEYGRVRLFIHRGRATFAESPDAGLTSSLWGTSACCVDFDRDGWLDILVVNYVDYDPAWPCKDGNGELDYCHPMVFPGTVAKLFRNRTTANGPIRFEDATVASGIGQFPSSGLGVVCADFNGDDWPDIFTANDGRPNHLWINQRDGTFAQEALALGVAHDGVGRALANMGVTIGDTHREGRFDLFITHLTEETNTFWRQKPRGIFSDRSTAAGLLRGQWRGTGFGTMFTDFNHDGWLDLVIANGRVARLRGVDHRPDDFWLPYRERNQLFAGVGPGQFQDRSKLDPALCEVPNVARTVVIGDVDGDAAPDLLITTIGGPARLLRNRTPDRGHGLLVRAIDPALKRDAIGATITVRAGESTYTNWLIPGQGYLSSHDPRVHFGLGSADHIDEIQVRWPDGVVERFPGGAVDRTIEVRKGMGTNER